jgi:hypothetical protein
MLVRDQRVVEAVQSGRISSSIRCKTSRERLLKSHGRTWPCSRVLISKVIASRLCPHFCSLGNFHRYSIRCTCIQARGTTRADGRTRIGWRQSFRLTTESGNNDMSLRNPVTSCRRILTSYAEIWLH